MPEGAVNRCTRPLIAIEWVEQPITHLLETRKTLTWQQVAVSVLEIRQSGSRLERTAMGS